MFGGRPDRADSCFAWVPVQEGGGQHRHSIRVTCGECEATKDWSAGHFVDPAHYHKRARRAGWNTTENAPSRTLCPACILKPRDHTMSALTAKVAPAAIGVPGEVIITARPIEVRAPTPDQRAAIRGLLEKHFDDGEGAYADGQSDQTIAEAVNVPRLIVEQIREVGYGPIRVNRELVALIAEVKAARADLTGLLSMAGEVEVRIATLEGRASALRGAS